MAATAYQTVLSRPQVFLWRMIVFLALAGLIVAILYAQVWEAFSANPLLNGLIVGVLLIGVVYSFRQVLRLYPEVAWVNHFRIADPGLAPAKPPVLLAPMALMLRDRKGQVTLSTTALRSILDSIGARLDEARDTTRYLVGLLVFLGLLGTFWGLLQTISSVGATINALDTGASESVVLFEELKQGLAAPLAGMGTAFSSSLFGLAGSLILGFLDLQAGQAQNRFYNELENWLAGFTEIQSEAQPAAGATPQLRFALNDMQRSISDLGDKIEMRYLNENSSEAVRDLATGVEKLIKQMRAEQKVVREWADEQAQQQAELATVLRQITDNSRPFPLREDGS
jgi:hypothetical protein